MPDIGEDYSEISFHRQRRNLIVGSIALLFIHVAELQVESHGAFMGWAFHVGRPEMVMWFLWVAVCYWLLRFYQYHRQRETRELRKEARKYLDRFLVRHALRHTVERLLGPRPSNLDDDETCEPALNELRVVQDHRSKIIVDLKPVWAIRKPDGSSRGIGAKEEQVEYEGSIVQTAHSVAYFRASLHSPFFTEYTLPYLIFGLAAAVSAWKWVMVQ